MKKTIAASILFVALLAIGPITNALTLADIELLTSLGLLTGDQAEIARQAIEAGSASGSAGASVRPDEFSSTECLVLTENMARGISGTAVTALQRFLQAQGHYLAQTLSGTYDNATLVAVTDFQIAQGLITSRTTSGAGNVGPLTREKVQEVSCAQPQAEAVTEETTASTTEAEITFQRRVRGSGSYVDPDFDGRYQMSFVQDLRSLDKKKALYEYRFDLGIKPNDDVFNWKVALTCDEEQIVTSRSDLSCNKTVLLRAATDGTKSVKLSFTNTTQIAQQIGLVFVALDKNEQELTRATFVKELEPKIPDESAQTVNGQSIVIGEVVLPANRLCNTDEQSEYLKYIMTRSNTPKGSILVPPPCYPGNVSCTSGQPQQYCEIKGTRVNSITICGGKEFFYDGYCRPIE